MKIFSDRNAWIALLICTAAAVLLAFAVHPLLQIALIAICIICTAILAISALSFLAGLLRKVK